MTGRLEKSVFCKLFNDHYVQKSPFLFIIDFELTEFILHPLEELQNSTDVLYDFCGVTNFSGNSLSKPVHLCKKIIGETDYKRAFDRVQHHQLEGDSYLLNLTFASEIDINLSADEIFAVSKAPYRLKYRDEFLFFSPERFVRIEDGLITTCPMKGTKPFVSEDSLRELMEDEKEAAEHVTVVDLLRNDLNMVADGVTVTSYRYPDYVERDQGVLIQTSSEITGRLREPHSPADAVIAMLPAGSVCGAPKKRTLEIIRESEQGPRGFYTGISGIFDGQALDTCVNIRYIEYIGGRTRYRSGGGITVYSRMEDEYKELAEKIYVPVSGNHKA